MNKKIALFAVALLAFASVGFAKAATPNTNEERNENQNLNRQQNRPQTITKTITGTIVSIGSDNSSFVIKIGNRNINVTTSNANIIRSNRTNMNFSDLKVGDKITITGRVTRTSNGFISSMTATTIRDLAR